MADTFVTPKTEDSLESRFEELGAKPAKPPPPPPPTAQPALVVPMAIGTAGDTEIFVSHAIVPPAPETPRAIELDADDAVPIVDRTAPFSRDAILAVAQTIRVTPSLAMSAATAQTAAEPPLHAMTPPPVAVRATPGPMRVASPPTPRPMPIAASAYATPQPRVNAPSLTSVPAPTIFAPTWPGGHTARPSSIAPLALDVGPPPAAMTTKLPAMRANVQVPPARPNTVRNAMIGAVLLGAVIAPVIGWLSMPTPTPTMASAATPRAVQTGKVHSAVFESPETAPLKLNTPSSREAEPDPVAVADLPSSPIAVAAPVVAAPAPRPAARPRVAAAAPPPPPVETQAPVAAPPPPPPPAPKPVAPPPTTGVVQVPESMMTITVDGEYRRVQGGRVVVSCGRHKITAGIKGTQVVDVPCGGAAAL